MNPGAEHEPSPEPTPTRSGGPDVIVLASPDEVCQRAASVIASRIDAGDRRDIGLGLATGSSPIGVYRELVRRHQAGLSFARVTTFNLDEYHPIAADDPGSFRRYMREHLLDHVDLDPSRAHIPDGAVAAVEVERHCAAYEQAVHAAGGIDLQLLGIGVNGHIGFNEPGSPRASRTRRVRLHERTRRANAAAFGGDWRRVPTHAITMGIGTITEARELLLVAFGASKRDAVQAALHGPIDEGTPASLLRLHPKVVFLLDHAAAGVDAASASRPDEV